MHNPSKCQLLIINCNFLFSFLGVKLDQKTNKLVSTIIKTENNNFDDNSAMKLLWEQQKKASSFSKASLMKWHPVVVRWCLSIYLKSPGIFLTNINLST